MSKPDKCPNCGELSVPGFSPSWACGSIEGYHTALCLERAAHAETKRELETWKHNAGTAVTVAIERIQTQRDAALARVRELEGLAVRYSGGSSADGTHFKIYIPTERVQNFEDDWEPETLGEAMPRKEGK